MYYCKLPVTFFHLEVGPLSPRTQMTHVLEDLTHKMEGHPPKKEVSWVLGINTHDIEYLYSFCNALGVEPYQT